MARSSWLIYTEEDGRPREALPYWEPRDRWLLRNRPKHKHFWRPERETKRKGKVGFETRNTTSS